MQYKNLGSQKWQSIFFMKYHIWESQLSDNLGGMNTVHAF